MLSRDAWNEFVQCLSLYNAKVFDQAELLTMVGDMLGENPDLYDEFKVINSFHAAAEFGNKLWAQLPISEIDLSQCRRCTPSYRALPLNYPRAKCSGRTPLCKSVLNNNWVSVPTGSEDFGVKNLRRNQYEEALFKCEDDRYEIDMVMDANRSAIKALEPINAELSRLAETTEVKWQYRLDKRSLSIMHLKAIARVYGDHGNEVLELLRKNPAGSIPIILNRLKEKAVEWGKIRQTLDKQWKEVLEKNYQKSLDHRSIYFKQQDRKAMMVKTLAHELRTAKERADLKSQGGGGSAARKVPALAAPETSSGSSPGTAATDHRRTAHMAFALPDVEIHRDVISLIMFVSSSGAGSCQGSRFADASQQKLRDVLEDMVTKLLGVPTAWVGASHDSKLPGAPAATVGSTVFTPYGKGVISAVHSDSKVVAVDLPSGTSFISASNILPQATESATNGTDGGLGASSREPVLMHANNRLYYMMRLYTMLYGRLRRAKELCRRASTQKRSVVKHWKDREIEHPRSDKPTANGKINTTQKGANGEAGNGGTKNAAASGGASPAESSTSTPSEQAIESQLRSHKAYAEFLEYVFDLASGKLDNATFEDSCRTLMGASTASYMMFTLDKLVNALMKQCAAICDEGKMSPCSKLQILFKNAHPPAGEASQLSRNVKLYESCALGVIDDTEGKESLYRIYLVPGEANSVAPQAGCHGPGVWDETMTWKVQPQICYELIGKTNVLRDEATLDPSTTGPDAYVTRYLSESGRTGFGGYVYTPASGAVPQIATTAFPAARGENGKEESTAKDTSQKPEEKAKRPMLFLMRNRRAAKKFLSEEGSLGYEDMDIGRDRKAREELISLRHALQWGLGTVKAMDALETVTDLMSNKTRHVARSEDTFFRIQVPYVPKDSERDDSGSSSGSGQEGGGRGSDDDAGESSKGEKEGTSSDGERSSSNHAPTADDLAASVKSSLAASSASFGDWLASKIKTE